MCYKIIVCFQPVDGNNIATEETPPLIGDDDDTDLDFSTQNWVEIDQWMDRAGVSSFYYCVGNFRS